MSSTAGSPSPVDMTSPWKKPFQQGWRREVVFRLEAVSTLCDVYYYHPSGLKMRSMADVEAFLSNHDCGDLTIDNFTFRKQLLLDERETVRIAEPRGESRVLQFLSDNVQRYLTHQRPARGAAQDAMYIMYRLRNFLVVNLRRYLIVNLYPDLIHEDHIRAEMENEWRQFIPSNEPVPLTLVFNTDARDQEPREAPTRREAPRRAAFVRDDQRPSTSTNGAQQSGTAARDGTTRKRQRKQRFPRRVEGDRVQERLSPTPETPTISQAREREPAQPEVPSTSQAQGHVSSSPEIPSASQSQERIPTPSGIPSTSYAQERVSSPLAIPSTSQSQAEVYLHPDEPGTSQSHEDTLPPLHSHMRSRETQERTEFRTLPSPPAPGTHPHHPLSPSNQSPSLEPQSQSSEPSHAIPPQLPSDFRQQLLRRPAIVGESHTVRKKKTPRATAIAETGQTHQTPGSTRTPGSPRALRTPRGRRGPGEPRAPRGRRVLTAPRAPRGRQNTQLPTQIPGTNTSGSETESGHSSTGAGMTVEDRRMTDLRERSNRMQSQEASYERTPTPLPSPVVRSTPRTHRHPDVTSGLRHRGIESRQSEHRLSRPPLEYPDEAMKKSTARHGYSALQKTDREQARHRRTWPRIQSSTRVVTRVSSVIKMAPGSNRPRMIRVTDTLVPSPASSRGQVTPTPSEPRARVNTTRALTSALYAPPTSPLPAEYRLPQVTQEVHPREDPRSFPYPRQRKRTRSLPQTREESQTSRGPKKSRSSEGSASATPKTAEPSGRFLQSSSPQPPTSREDKKTSRPSPSRKESVPSRPSTPLQKSISPQPSTSRKTQISTRPPSSSEESLPPRPSTSRQRSTSPQPPRSRQESKSAQPSISRKRPVTMRPPSSLEDEFSSDRSRPRKRPISSETSSSGEDD